MSTTEEELKEQEDAGGAGASDTEQPDATPLPAEGDGGEPPAPPPELEAGPAPPNPVRDRLLLPLLLPIAAMAAIALYVLNVSRIFLAGGDGAASVVTGILITVGILAGAAIISASPQLRSSTLTMVLATLMVLVVSAGLITLGPSEEHGEGEGGGFAEPAGPPDFSLQVDALPSLKFQSDSFTAPAGILEFVYVNEGGSHTLLFDESEFTGFELAVDGQPTDKGKVEIEEGEYTIYCGVPGHRAAGMEATLAITPPAAPPPGAPAPPGSAPTGESTPQVPES